MGDKVKIFYFLRRRNAKGEWEYYRTHSWRHWGTFAQASLIKSKSAASGIRNSPRGREAEILEVPVTEPA